MLWLTAPSSLDLATFYRPRTRIRKPSMSMMKPAQLAPAVTRFRRQAGIGSSNGLHGPHPFS